MKGNIISSYTREQAVDDGVLYRVPENVRLLHRIKDDTCLSAGLFNLLRDDDERMTRVRVSALLVTFILACRHLDDTFSEFPFLIMGNTVKVWAVLDGDGLTLMLPEDY